MRTRISPVSRFQGRPKIPGDKSISHRGLIFGAIADGITEVTGILEGEDVQSTARCLKQLGVDIYRSGDRTLIKGIGTRGFQTPDKMLDCGNSGTTMRVLMGVLAGRNITARMTGDGSLVKRPMKRVATPLKLMGAKFELSLDDFAPLSVTGTSLSAIDFELKIASAQIKTAIIMAAITANGTTKIKGETKSRDHTERFLPYFGGKIAVKPNEIEIPGGQQLQARQVRVPSDPSTAAFWIAAASLIPGARLSLENISLNPTRTGFIEVLKRMGARIDFEITANDPEPVGRIEVAYAKLHGVEVHPAEIPSLIDELPLLAVVASQAEGMTRVTGAEELRVKESDRLQALAQNLRRMGGVIDDFSDGFSLSGPQNLNGAFLESFHDHRIAMAFSIAALVATGKTEINDAECVAISYPEFFEHLRELSLP